VRLEVVERFGTCVARPQGLARRGCEATQLAGFSHQEALAFFDAPPPGYNLHIEPQPPAVAQVRYVQRYNVLSEAAGYTSLPSAFDTE